MTVKTKAPPPGHEYGGNMGWEVACKCGRRFNAKTYASRRRMWRDHVEEVRAARVLVDDFAVVIGWARADLTRQMLLMAWTKRAKAEGPATMMLVRVAERVGALLKDKAR